MVELHALAALEMADAAQYYEDRVPGLGERFLGAVRLAFEFVERTPHAQPPWLFAGVPSGVRHSIVRGFQHSVVFITEPRLLVVTIRHHASHPTRWVERIGGA